MIQVKYATHCKGSADQMELVWFKVDVAHTIDCYIAKVCYDFPLEWHYLSKLRSIMYCQSQVVGYLYKVTTYYGSTLDSSEWCDKCSLYWLPINTIAINL